MIIIVESIVPHITLNMDVFSLPFFVVVVVVASFFFFFFLLLLSSSSSSSCFLFSLFVILMIVPHCSCYVPHGFAFICYC